MQQQKTKERLKINSGVFIEPGTTFTPFDPSSSNPVMDHSNPLLNAEEFFEFNKALDAVSMPLFQQHELQLFSNEASEAFHIPFLDGDPTFESSHDYNQLTFEPFSIINPTSQSSSRLNSNLDNHTNALNCDTRDNDLIAPDPNAHPLELFTNLPNNLKPNQSREIRKVLCQMNPLDAVISNESISQLVQLNPTIISNDSILSQERKSNSPCTITSPESVPIPILYPRKQRHRSRNLLTNEEKKANHILSEQKRRLNIRMGFKALTNLVPALRGRFVDEEDKEESPKKTKRANVIQLRNTCGVHAKNIILSETIHYLRYLKDRIDKLKIRSLLLNK